MVSINFCTGKTASFTVNTLHIHCSHKNIIQVSDKTSSPLAAVFSQEGINNKTPQKEEDIEEDIFPLSLGLWAAMIELSVTVGHAIASLISRRITILSAVSYSTI